MIPIPQNGRTTDVIIVGGGVIGLSIAWRLLGLGASATIYDAGEPGAGASAAAAGMLAPGFENEHTSGAHPALDRFSRTSLTQWSSFAPELVDRSGVDVDYRDDGVIGVCTDEDSAARWRTAATAEPGARYLSGDDARRLEPALSDRVVGGVFRAREGQVDPVRTIAALRAVVERLGGLIRVGETVEAVLVENGRAVGVRSQDGSAYASAVVVAAGAAAARLTKRLGAPCPVFPVKGELAVMRPENDARFRRVVRSRDVYFAPKGDGRLLVGATERPHDSRPGYDEGAVRALLSRAAELAPGVVAAPPGAVLAGLRPGTPDSAPILGRSRAGPEGLFLAVGHHRNGVLLAPASADAIADAVLGGGDHASGPCVLFSADRFKRLES